MARLPQPGADANTWGDILNEFLSESLASDGTIKPSALSTAGAADNSAVVHKMGAEAIAGGKTFLLPVTVVTPTAPNHATTKAYVDSTVAAGAPEATSTTKGIVQLTGDLAGTASAPTVPGLAGKEPTITAGTTGQYYRGDKSWQTLDKATVGLSNADNTSDINKPISTATQAALNAKPNTSSLAAVATTGSYTDLINQPTIPAAQVNSDWNALSGSARILNKPTIPAQFNPIAGTNVTLTGTYPNITIASTPTAGVTDISISQTATTVTVESNTGADGVITAATATTAGAFPAADKTKLDGIAAGATANATDAQLRDRTTHTGAQAIGTVTGLQGVLDAKAPLASPTFTGTVTVPTPVNSTDAATKTYVDTAASTGTPDATTSLKGKIQLAGDLAGTAAAPTVPGLSGKEPTVTAGTTTQYYRGDKSWQTLDKTAVGLANVSNTSDANKPISTATQTALDLKLTTTNNLSDLTNPAAARTNLGLGTAATISATAGGDLTGTLPNPTVAKVNGVTITNAPTAASQILTATSTTAASWSAAPSAGSQALTPNGVKTANYTATAGDLVPADATSSAFTVTLPAAPADKSRLVIKKIDTTSNIVTVAAAGTDVFNAAAGSTSVNLSLQNQALSLQYASTGAIWYVVSDDLPLPQLDNRYITPATAIATLGTRLTGTSVFVIGDSITANGVSSVGVYNELAWGFWASLLSGGQVQFAGLSGTAGYTASQIQTTHLPVAIAAKPNACVVLAGTNDVNTSATQAIPYLKSMYASLQAAGIQPIAATIPARVAARTNAALLNAFIRRYALANGLTLVDFAAVTTDPATGGYLSGLSSDNLHPTAAGAKVMGQALASALVTRRAGYVPQLSYDNADGVFPNGCFLNGTNGLPTGWTINVAGTGGSLSFITGDASILGNWWEIAKTSGTDVNFYGTTATIAVSPGDVVGLGFRLHIPTWNSGALFQVGLASSASSAVFCGINFAAATTAPGATWLTGVVPAGTTGMSVKLVLRNGVVTGRLAQMSVVNLTASGLI